MLTELRTAFRPALVLLLLLAGLTGIAYPAAITGIAQLALPYQANGSMITARGTIIGSELIAQGFTSPRYFQPRPSAAGKGYDATNSSATNLAPGDKGLRDAIAARVAAARKDGLTKDGVPADLVTSSASGLDPDLSPEAAFWQVARVARARNLSETRVHDLVAENIDYPLLGLIGEPHVNVLLLNRQLDAISAK
jgi:K+-transporting ATPase ATPase C chain